MTALRLALVLLLLLAVTGCARQPVQMGHVLTINTVTAIRDIQPSSTPVTIHGTMTDKCPVAGCWFKVRDRSGVVKVDTKAAGFVVVDVPLGSQVTVSGTYQTTPERLFLATGLRY